MRSGLLRGLSALGALLIVFTQLSGAVHLALLPHRFCPLHGIEDVRRAQPGSAEAPVAIAAPPRRSTSIDVPQPNEATGEACVIASLAHERVAVAEPCDSGSLHSAPDAQWIPVFGHLRLGAGESLLLIAPKQGPPV